MAQLPISSITATGREERIDDNFTELYAVASPLSGSWTAFTPTVTSGTGTLTSVSGAGRYMQVGKTVFIYARVDVTTNGTGATDIRFTPPVTAVGLYYMLAGRDHSNGLMQQVRINNTFVQINNYDGTYPGHDGAILTFSGVYEAA